MGSLDQMAIVTRRRRVFFCLTHQQVKCIAAARFDLAIYVTMLLNVNCRTTNNSFGSNIAIMQLMLQSFDLLLWEINNLYPIYFYGTHFCY